MFLISKTTSPGGNVTETTYDKMENVVCQKEYGKGSSPAVTRTQYNLLGRVIKEVSPNWIMEANMIVAMQKQTMLLILIIQVVL